VHRHHRCGGIAHALGTLAARGQGTHSTADLTLARKSARELARLIRTRAVSPVEVLDAYLAVIEALNPKLNAIVTLAAEQARDGARRAEAAVMKGEPLGPLHGLPIGVKDVTPTAGIRTTFRLAAVQGLRADGGRRSDTPAQGCRRHRARQDQHARIRLRRQHQQRTIRPDPQSVEPGA
jgi:hypothetical protein